MAFDSVPWAVGGGSENSEGHARMLTYFMFQGTEGVLSATDMEVKPLATPGGAVRISPGGFTAIARGSGQLYEAYMGRCISDTVVPIDPNNGSSPRTDLIIALVQDPYIPGSPWNIPGDQANGPYAVPWVIKNVPSTITSFRELGNNWSCVTLAKVTLPANTATVTAGMITNLRRKVGPPPPPAPPLPPVIDQPIPDNDPVETSVFELADGPSSGSQDLTSSQVGTWRTWPTASEFTVTIPTWANVADVILLMHNVIVTDDVWGEVRIEIGNGEIYTPARVYDFNKSTGKERFPIVAGGKRISLPSVVRGKAKRFRINARSLAAGGDHPGTLQVDRGTLIELRIDFKEQT